MSWYKKALQWNYNKENKFNPYDEPLRRSQPAKNQDQSFIEQEQGEVIEEEPRIDDVERAVSQYDNFIIEKATEAYELGKDIEVIVSDISNYIAEDLGIPTDDWKATSTVWTEVFVIVAEVVPSDDDWEIREY